MKNAAPTPSIKDKIAFFDSWVLANITVDPKVEREKARSAQSASPEGPTTPPSSEINVEVDVVEAPAELAVPLDDPGQQVQAEARGGGQAAPLSHYVSDPGIGNGDDVDEDEEGDFEEDQGTGLVGLPLGKKYQGEEKGEGWQKTRTQKGKKIATKYYNEDEKTKSRIDFGSGGEATSDGSRLDGERGFVVDPDTGDVHQFKEASDEKATTVETTHHSSPLAGGDVAGAGKMKIDRGQVESINDQSGHYKPGGMFTFQAVRAVNMGNLSAELKQKLRKTVSETKEGGKAENADTIEQLIATEIQAARVKFVTDMDKEQEVLEAALEEISNKAEKAAAFKEMQGARVHRIKQFHELAAELEDDLRDDLPDNPLVDDGFDDIDSSDESLPPAVMKLAKARDAVRNAVKKRLKDDPDADVSDLTESEAKLGGMLEREGFETKKNKEATVSLLGKAGMLSDEEYADLAKELKEAQGKAGATRADKQQASDAFDAKVNRASAVKQLKQPLGEEAFAALLKSGGDAVAKALEAHGLEGNAPGSVDKLKVLLGEEKAKTLSDQEITDLSLKHKVGKVDNPRQGVEQFGFDVGKATQATLTGQQFLQTGGNEAQIRNKASLLDEIKQGSKGKQDAPPVQNDKLDEALSKAAAEREKEIDDLVGGVMNNPEIKRASLTKALKKVESGISQLVSDLEYWRDCGPGPYAQKVIDGEIELVTLEDKKKQITEEINGNVV